MYGLKVDWSSDDEARPRHLVLDDYVGGVPRWCPGCGDHAALSSVQRLARDEQLPPEQTVVVSGIGCSSRFPHYMKTYGFHGLHGRPLPIAAGVRSRRPDLHLFVVTGDGDCCAIGTGHWIHAIRYNMRMTVLMFDNNIYGLTKMQSSPTTPVGLGTNTHPLGSVLEPLKPLAVTLGISNVSFVAQTVDWNPMHMFETIKAAHRHQGLSFIRVLQRCPHYMDGHFDPIQRKPEAVTLLSHERGIQLAGPARGLFPNVVEHDPSDLTAAFHLSLRTDTVPIGLLYRNDSAPTYDTFTSQGLDMAIDDKVEAMERELDRFLI